MPDQVHDSDIRPRGAFLNANGWRSKHIRVNYIDSVKQPIQVKQYDKQLSRQLEHSRVLQRQFVQPELKIEPELKPIKRFPKFQIGLATAALFVVVAGAVVTFQTFRTNHQANTAVALLSTNANQNLAANSGAVASSTSNVPNTSKPSARAYDQYVVNADLARYIKISKLSVDARVLQVGVNKDGNVEAPNNVYDAAWYNASAKPGQVGATLIDGHVSSWDSAGIFHDLNKLVGGDSIEIITGDSRVLNYKVVASKTYAADKVDMQAAISSIVPGKSGLNLITCAGSVKQGTSEFTERLVVFAVLQ